MECFGVAFSTRKRRSIDRKFPARQNIYSKLPKKEPDIISFENPNDLKFYEAKYNVMGIGPEKLSYRKGDILEVEPNIYNLHMCKARVRYSLKIGYVSLDDLEPRSAAELEPWYFSNITRTEAETALLQSPNGTFLVRSHSTPDIHILSIRAESHDKQPTVKHYRILRKEEGYYISTGLVRKELDQLIRVYLEDRVGYLGLYQRLIRPCSKNLVVSLSSSL